ncbi:hypothetical protein F2Q70_00020575 [Brassica cretica]|uniref:Uncharacterized protein n=1 Tax=Brassica cretica TaxID=69181 RepID=A0A8S9GQG0_BRACR|nr:hypothetical protein F2Q70_00020575 [Brassica cretica]
MLMVQDRVVSLSFVAALSGFDAVAPRACVSVLLAILVSWLHAVRRFHRKPATLEAAHETLISEEKCESLLLVSIVKRSLPFSSKKIKSVDPEEDVEEKDYKNSDEEDGNHGVERYGSSSSSSVFDFSASHSARDSGLPSTNDVFSQNGGKRISTATNPNAEEAADLLRFELYCWILLALALEPLQIVWTISFLLIQQMLRQPCFGTLIVAQSLLTYILFMYCATLNDAYMKVPIMVRLNSWFMIAQVLPLSMKIPRRESGGDPFEKFEKIFVDIMEWSIDNPTPANILYISGDMNTYMTRLINQLGVVCYNTLLCVRESLTAFPTTGGRPFITRDFSFVSSVWSWFELSHGRPPFFNRFSDKPSVPLAFLKKKKRSPRQRKVLVDPVKRWSGRTLARGNALIRSSGLETSVPCWTRPRSSSISSIECGTSSRECGVSSLSVVQLMGADGLAHSAGDSWQSAHLSLAECSGPNQCGRVRAVTEPLLRSFQLMHNGIIST